MLNYISRWADTATNAQADTKPWTLAAIFYRPFMLSKLLIKYIFKYDEEFCIFLGAVKQKGTPVALFSSQKIWSKEPLAKKIKSLLTLKWIPSDHLIQLATKETFNDTMFGNPSDYNEGLFKINAWHNSQKWNLENLTKEDLLKSDGLNALAVLVNTKHRKLTSNYLHLNLYEKAPSICFLLHPMIIKIPVTSIQYYTNIHSAFAFNEIRQSNIANADDLISYIYDLQNIQQKTAIALHEFIYLIDYNEKNKGEALLTQAELSAISEAETILTNLKASIEKIIVILGLIFNLKNLETKKTHKSKLDALDKAIPEPVKKLHYYELIADLIKSESIEELNNYRTGLLHKKGISALQPHSYVGQNAQEIPLKEIFSFLIEQHSKNSAVIICTYALLTDELVKLKRPGIKFEDLPF